jgi:hypothetical protein
MKTKGSAITRRILGIGITAATMIVIGAASAFAMPADPDPKVPAAPAAPAVPLQDTSSGRAWIIPLIIGGVVVLAAALIGRVRIRRSRGVAWGA